MTYQLSASVTYVLKIGPSTNPRFPTRAQEKIIHTRACMLKTSSILPATTMVGIEDNTPVMNLATMTAAKEGTAAAITQKMQYNNVEVTKRVLRPKASEKGGKKTPPIPCPRTYLRRQNHLASARDPSCETGGAGMISTYVDVKANTARLWSIP